MAGSCGWNSSVRCVMPMPLRSRRRLPTSPPPRDAFARDRGRRSTNWRSISIRRCGGAPSWQSAASACWRVCRISCRRFRIPRPRYARWRRSPLDSSVRMRATGPARSEPRWRIPRPLVRARAVEGLGLVGDAASAPAIVTAAAGCDARIASIAPDDEELAEGAGDRDLPARAVCARAAARLRAARSGRADTRGPAGFALVAGRVRASADW